MNEPESFQEKVIANAEAFGQFERIGDSYWYYRVGNRLILTSTGLRALAEELDRRNADWYAKVRKDIKMTLSPRVSTIVLLAALLATIIVACLLLYI